jgi:hypothetical protein
MIKRFHPAAMRRLANRVHIFDMKIDEDLEMP